MRRALGALAAAALAACAAGQTGDGGEASAREELLGIERRIERGELPKIEFEFDRDAVAASSHETLRPIARLLLDNPKLKLFVMAHTDDRGSREYNEDLSERRAKAVKAFLVGQGVPPPSVRYMGYGFSRPVADNATEEGRARNRRVEFRVTSRDWETVY